MSLRRTCGFFFARAFSGGMAGASLVGPTVASAANLGDYRFQGNDPNGDNDVPNTTTLTLTAPQRSRVTQARLKVVVALGVSGWPARALPGPRVAAPTRARPTLIAPTASSARRARRTRWATSMWSTTPTVRSPATSTPTLLIDFDTVQQGTSPSRAFSLQQPDRHRRLHRRAGLGSVGETDAANVFSTDPATFLNLVAGGSNAYTVTHKSCGSQR